MLTPGWTGTNHQASTSVPLQALGLCHLYNNSVREASAAAMAILACQLEYLELTKTQPAGHTGEGLLCQ